MANIDNRPISDLVKITSEYYDTHSVPSKVPKKETVKAVKNFVFSLESVGLKTIGMYLDAENKKAPILEEDIKLLPEYGFIMELALMDKMSEDLSVISIDDLEVSNRVKNALKNNGIKNLEELLDTDYSVLESISYFGPDCLSELKRYIHSLGYSIKNEVITIEDKIRELEDKGVRLIQDDLMLDSKVVNFLNKNGIFTLQELIEFGDGVYNLVGMGPVRETELRERLEEKGISLKSTQTEKVQQEETQLVEPQQEQSVSSETTEAPQEDTFVPAVLPSDDIIEQLKNENSSIRERIEKKELLVSEYDKLIQEKQELIQREQELDKEIAKRLETLQSLKNKEEGQGYGRK